MGCAKNIQILNNTLTDGVLVMSLGCGGSINVLIDGNLFGDLGQALYEGRLSIRGDSSTVPIGVTVSNNHFGPGCQADGIQLVGLVSGAVIGPGNVFEGIIQSGPVHCDSIQFYAEGSDNIVTGNWFKNSSVALQHQGASEMPKHTMFTNNVISNVAQFQVGNSADFVFEHNTIYNLTDVFRFDTEPSSNVSYRSNIIMGNTAGSPGGTTLAAYNLCSSSNLCSGSNAIIGTPTFVGGAAASITSFAGWQLTVSSLGVNAGHDGLNIGMSSTGGVVTPPTPAPLDAPSNLRLISFTSNSAKIQFDYTGTNQTGFSVQRKKTTAGSYGQVNTTTALSYSDSGLTESTQYCYQVTAYNLSSTSASSNELCLTTAQAPQPPPSGSWTACAVENQMCAFTGTRDVRYGANGIYVIKTLTNGTLCSNAVFTDPVPGVVKACEFSTSTTPSLSQSLFPTQIPVAVNDNDGVNYEMGLRFTAARAGKIVAIRFYKSSLESNSHTGKIYSARGVLLASVVFTAETASGWQQMNLASPLSVSANTEYTVSVNTGNKYYVDTVGGLASQIISGDLKSVIGKNGVFGPVGALPTSTWNSSNYFRDVVFQPAP